uniref:Uncharacterized protein n=1 Tax=Tanacetum cinerariifolium TaxID=118510 RepID=A0A699HY34_TANCI|nr:hypothetical protein [Tanacetum cinerariifolium]
MAKDDHILTTMRFIPKHETIQKYGAVLPDTLTNQAIKESDAYKTYYDLATGKKSGDDENDDEVSENADNEDDDDNANKEHDDGQDDDNEHTESNNDGDDFVYPMLSTFDEEERHEEKLDEEEEGDNVEKEKLDEEKTNEEEEVNELYNDVNINLEGKDTEMTDALLANVQAT